MARKYYAVHDAENYRFVIRPLMEDGSMSISKAICTIRKRTHFTWRNLAEFCGVSSQSEMFKLAYVHNGPMSRHPLKDFLVLDTVNNCAFLYDKEHKPEGVLPAHTGPQLTNGEDANVAVTERVPAKVVSRVKIYDSLDRLLTLSLTPTNGYLLGMQSRSLAIPGMTYSVTGTYKSLNKLLRSIYFVGTAVGTAAVVVKIDDGAGQVASVVSETVNITIGAATNVSIPDIVLPSSPAVETGKYNSFSPITVTDTDGKLMEFRMSVYGCYVAGFKSLATALIPGKVKNIYGRPVDINKDIAELQVYPFNTNAQIGVELICRTTRIRKYLVLNVSGQPCAAPKVYVNDNVLYDVNKQFDNEATTGTVSAKVSATGASNSVTIPAQESQQEQQQEPQQQEPPATPKTFTFEITQPNDTLTVDAPYDVISNVLATGFTDEETVTVTMTAEGCEISVNSGANTTEVALTDTVANIRTALGTLTLTPLEESGTVTFHADVTGSSDATLSFMAIASE